MSGGGGGSRVRSVISVVAGNAPSLLGKTQWRSSTRLTKAFHVSIAQIGIILFSVAIVLSIVANIKEASSCYDEELAADPSHFLPFLLVL